MSQHLRDGLGTLYVDLSRSIFADRSVSVLNGEEIVYTLPPWRLTTVHDVRRVLVLALHIHGRDWKGAKCIHSGAASKRGVLAAA